MALASVDLDLAPEDQAAADTVRRLLREKLSCSDLSFAGWSPSVWRDIGELGVFALGTEEMPSFSTLGAVCEALGEFALEGPLAATIAVADMLPDPDRAMVIAGEAIVSLGIPPSMPWGGVAHLFVSIDENDTMLFVVEAREPIGSLSGENWARVRGRAGRRLGAAGPVFARYNLALGAYMVGAARRLVSSAADYLQERRQFGRAVGDFQGVAFPLADVITSVDAAQILVRIAAARFDAGFSQAAEFSAFARLAASRAALRAAFAAHQAFGAFGVTEAGPVFSLSRRLQQWALQPPSEAKIRSALPLRFPVDIGFLFNGEPQRRRPAQGNLQPLRLGAHE